MIRAVYLPATGPGPEESDWKLMEEAEILADNRMLKIGSLQVFPPLAVINEYMSRGIYDRGMGGGMRWEPCSIASEVYERYVRSLGCRIANAEEIPGDIEVVEHWYMYRQDVLYGVPYEGNRILHERIQDLQRQCLEADKQGDTARADALYWQANEAEKESADFFNRHVKRPQP
ncbi:MAG: hypothetical protein IPK50_02980 [Fibrobacterota bacterium]|nr:MAG: hypothetical protein IPK50_02980 [Fibrobacterota bacterium]